MGFEFSTIIFQAINFFVLLAVLSWFFYRPLQRIMRRREGEIAERIDQADRRAREADEAKQRLAAQQQDAARRAEELVAAARKRAGEERERVLEEARSEATRLVDTATRTARERESDVLARTEARVVEAAIEIAANLVRTAAGEQVHLALLDRLFSSGFPAGPSSRLLLDDIRAGGQLVVESAYPLTQDERDRIAALVSPAALARPPAVEVRVAPGLIAGVRVLSHDLVIDMSLRRALEDLRAAMPEAG
jgi:F-type H+-transporting ATPase subunit b